MSQTASVQLMTKSTGNGAPMLWPGGRGMFSAVSTNWAAGSVAIFAGNGCRGAIDQVLALASKLQAPVMHTFRGKDLMAYDHPHWIGGVGLIGGAPGTDALQAAELMLMLGSDYPYSEFLPTKSKVIQIDERGFVLGRRAPVTLGITGSVGLDELRQRRPAELSGGQQQRVAIARALITRPDAVFADEPTGALDSRTGRQVLDLLAQMTRELNQTIVMVTHDPVVASRADRVIFLADGAFAEHQDGATTQQIAERMTGLETW